MKSFWYIVCACAACVLGYIIITGIRTWMVRAQGHFARADQVSDISRASDAIYREVSSPDRKPAQVHFNVGGLGSIFGRGKMVGARAINTKITPSISILLGRER